MYSLTKAGDGFLSLSIDVLAHYQSVLHNALKAYEKTDEEVGKADEEKEAPKRRRQGRRRG
jgi:hypothetical protein